MAYTIRIWRLDPPPDGYRWRVEISHGDMTLSRRFFKRMKQANAYVEGFCAGIECKPGKVDIGWV